MLVHEVEKLAPHLAWWHAKLKHWHAIWHIGMFIGTFPGKNEKMAHWNAGTLAGKPCWHATMLAHKPCWHASMLTCRPRWHAGMQFSKLNFAPLQKDWALGQGRYRT